MAITIQEQQIQKGTQTDSGSKFTREWIMLSDTQLSEVEAINAFTGRIDDAHPEWGSAKITGIEVESEDGNENYVWRVVVTYEGSNYSDPTLEPPVVRFGSRQYTEIVRKVGTSVFGPYSVDSAAQNSAGDPFDPPLQVTKSRPIAVIQQNMESFDPAWIGTYENSLIDTGNNGAEYTTQKIVGINVQTFQARMLKIDAIPKEYTFATGEGIGTQESTIEYWDVTYTIEFAAGSGDSFLIDKLDDGYRELVGGEIKQIMTEDTSGNDIPVQTPVRLDGSGGQLAPTADPVYLTFYTQPVLSWDLLDIPTNPRRRNTVDPIVGSSE